MSESVEMRWIVQEEEDEEEEEEEEVEGDGRWDSDPEPPVLLVSDLNDDLLSGSYLTVTLQRPHKAKRQFGKSNIYSLICLHVVKQKHPKYNIYSCSVCEL